MLILSFTTFLKLWILGFFIIALHWSGFYYFGVLCNLFVSFLVFSPLFFVKKRKNLFAIIIALIISLVVFVDIVYFSDRTTLPNVGLLELLGVEAGGATDAIIDIIKWQYFLLFTDIVLMTIFYKPIKNIFHTKLLANKSMTAKEKTYNLVAIAMILLMLFLSILASGKDTLSNVYNKSYDTVSTAQYYGVLIAHIIDTVRYIDQETNSLSTNEQQDLQNWVSKHKPIQGISSFNGISAGKNIIMIQVESLASFTINQTINNQPITPNLDDLASGSFFFPNNRYITEAGHSSDADFVANTSYFPLQNAVTIVRYGRDNFSSLPRLLDDSYSAFAYHGFVESLYNRNIAYRYFGYDRFLSSSDYSDGPKINMGLNDGTFLNETVDYVKEQPKPSLSSLITLSSHTPFKINYLTRDLGLDPETLPNQVAGYLENIHYTDKALGDFFDKLKEYDLYDDSLIIIYGDHTPALSEEFSIGSIYYDPLSNQALETPIIIKLPNQTEGEVYHGTGTNLDIMPTILDLVGVNTDNLMFGQSLFYQIENDVERCPDHIIIFDGLGDCETARREEENISSMIIRYNQFENLP